VLASKNRYWNYALNDAWNEGFKEGFEEGRKEGRYNVITEIEELLKKGLSIDAALQKIRQETSLPFNNLATENN